MSDATSSPSTSRSKTDYALNDWVSANDLPAPVRDQLLKRIETLPRLPAAVQRLLSQEFIDKATSSDLGKVVMSEPAVAAQVIAAVNSPLYKLRNPVDSIGQAITFLGVNQVRAICIQRLLTKAFSSSDARVGLALDSVWHTNSAATLLLPKLVQAFRLAEPAALTSQIILSFVGQLGVAALSRRLPSGYGAAWTACCATGWRKNSLASTPPKSAPWYCAAGAFRNRW